MARASRDTTIFGAGPVGLAAALALSGRSGVRVIAATLPTAMDAARVDMVPAAFMAFLLELGVHPAQVGVRELHDVRFIAWDGAMPEAVHGAAMAHVERPGLDLALLAAVERTSAIRVRPCSASSLAGSDDAMIDATGRRAISATRIIGLAEPWVARVFSRRGAFDKMAQAFRMAALPAGYIYRLGSPRLLAIGVVLNKAVAGMTPRGIEAYVHDAGAGWVFEGVGPLDSIQSGKGGIASLQWTAGSTTMLRVGDASLARDSLSTQGLCSGISDAVSHVRGADVDRWAGRQREQLERHLEYLAKTIERSRFYRENPWIIYHQFLKRAAEIFYSCETMGPDSVFPQQKLQTKV